MPGAGHRAPGGARVAACTARRRPATQTAPDVSERHSEHRRESRHRLGQHELPDAHGVVAHENGHRPPGSDRHAHAGRRQTSSTCSEGTARNTQRNDRRRRGWMTGTAIPKARPPEGRSRPRRRHGHAARSDHQPRGRPGDSNQAPSPAHALGPSDHVSQITLDSHSNRPAEITATPHLPCPPATARGPRPPTWPARPPPTLPPGRDTESANMRTSSNAGVW